MHTDDERLPVEESDEGYPIEISTDERIAEFLAEDRLTPALRRLLEEKLRQPKKSES